MSSRSVSIIAASRSFAPVLCLSSPSRENLGGFSEDSGTLLLIPSRKGTNAEVDTGWFRNVKSNRNAARFPCCSSVSELPAVPDCSPSVCRALRAPNNLSAVQWAALAGRARSASASFAARGGRHLQRLVHGLRCEGPKSFMTSSHITYTSAFTSFLFLAVPSGPTTFPSSFTWQQSILQP